MGYESAIYCEFRFCCEKLAYIVDLITRVITVSLKTVEIVDKLPGL